MRYIDAITLSLLLAGIGSMLCAMALGNFLQRISSQLERIGDHLHGIRDELARVRFDSRVGNRTS